MSHMSQPMNTPMMLYRAVYRWRHPGGKWRYSYRYYWTYDGAVSYGLPSGETSEDREWWIESATVDPFVRTP